MSTKQTTDPAKLPWLGRKLLWLDAPKTVDRLIYALIAICAALFAADFLYHKHTYVAVEEIPGAYGLWSLLVCVVLMIVVKVMRALLSRPESYYAPTDTETEDYPEDGLGREGIDA